MAEIEGLKVKELHCKNDDCRKLLGYERIKSGVLIFQCYRCRKVSIFKIKYPAGQEFIEKLQSLNEKEIEKGGEID